MTDAVEIILALDVGQVRIGLALARSDTRLAAPLTTINNDEQIWPQLQKIVNEQAVTQLVVGWPRNLSGQATSQTDYVEAFIAELKQYLALPIFVQDEAVTSKQAEAELEQRHKPYTKADIDSLSAVYILDDYLHEMVAN